MIDRADLPALHYLFVLSQGADAVGRAQHAYVVVDEAQDVSPLDLLCLRHLEQRPCFTLLGDLAQSIYAHRGLTSWDEAARSSPGGPTASQSAGSATAPRPRSPPSPTASGAGPPPARRLWPSTATGPRPCSPPCPRRRTLPLAVAGAVSELRRGGYASVGIITRTPARARALAPLLARAGLPDAQLALAPDFAYRGGVIVLPVALAKGLEFDAAVVVDADGATYGPSAFDARLLYVALTRALHALRVIWRPAADASSPAPRPGGAGLLRQRTRTDHRSGICVPGPCPGSPRSP